MLGAFLVGQLVKKPPAMWETWVLFLGWEDPPEEGMATNSSILAWRIPWTEEPGGLQSIGSQRVRHDWATKHSTAQLHVHSLPITSMQIIPKFSLYYYVKMTMLEPLENLVTVKTEPERYVYILIPWICDYYFTVANMQNPFARIAKGSCNPSLNYRHSSWVIQLLLFSC